MNKILVSVLVLGLALVAGLRWSLKSEPKRPVDPLLEELVEMRIPEASEVENLGARIEERVRQLVNEHSGRVQTSVEVKRRRDIDRLCDEVKRAMMLMREARLPELPREAAPMIPSEHLKRWKRVIDSNRSPREKSELLKEEFGRAAMMGVSPDAGPVLEKWTAMLDPSSSVYAADVRPWRFEAAPLEKAMLVLRGRMEEARLRNEVRHEYHRVLEEYRTIVKKRNEIAEGQERIIEEVSSEIKKSLELALPGMEPSAFEIPKGELTDVAETLKAVATLQKKQEARSEREKMSEKELMRMIGVYVVSFLLLLVGLVATFFGKGKTRHVGISFISAVCSFWLGAGTG